MDKNIRKGKNPENLSRSRIVSIVLSIDLELRISPERERGRVKM